MAVSGVGKIAEAKTTFSTVKGLACSHSETGKPVLNNRGRSGVWNLQADRVWRGGLTMPPQGGEFDS
jgi:hypothetical protein